MSTTTIYLIRHGEAEAEEFEDPRLSSVGRRQASAVASRLRSIGFTECYHGPSRRTTETAAVLEEATGRSSEPSSLAADRTPFPLDWSLVPTRYHHDLKAVPANERDEDGCDLEASLAAFSRIEEEDRMLLAVTHTFVIGWFVGWVLEAPW